jgi:uncharacterized protein YhbP (UPF0306 family)
LSLFYYAKEEAMDTTAQVQPWVLEYLAAQQTLTLATASAQGIPHAATFLYVNDGVGLTFWTQPDATTARHIEQNPAVAFAIDRQGSTWRETQSLQGTGECRRVEDPATIAELGKRFSQKYATSAARRTSGIAFYQIAPNSLGFVGAATAVGAGQLLGIGYQKNLIFSVFRDLPPEQVTALAARMETVEVAAGTVVVRQGARGETFYIIVNGELEVSREDDGVTRTLDTLRKGQFFGEMAILRDLPRTATVRATVPTTLLAMGREDFRELVGQSLTTTEDFDQVIRRRLDEIGRLGGA